ncbi:MAG: hypothetical protein ACJLS2_07275 [Microcella pacifica]
MSIRRNALLAAIGLTSALALTISGCAGTGGTEAPASSGQGDIPSDTEGTVRILMESVPDTDIVVDLVDSFNEEYPGIAVEIENARFRPDARQAHRFVPVERADLRLDRRGQPLDGRLRRRGVPAASR